MSYQGGKSKNSKFILDILNNSKFDNMDYLEPFMGYCHILRRIKNKGSYTATDSNDNLSNLMKYVQTNTSYPDISKDEYKSLKMNKSTCKIKRAFASYCYSYNGKEFGGYTMLSKPQANGVVRNYPEERKRYYQTLYKNETFSNTKLIHCDYRVHNVKNNIIYCDPPYKNTTKYNKGDFDHDIFWETMRKWSKYNHVFISEYSAPDDFICIAEKSKWSSLSGRGSDSLRTEKLFVFINSLAHKNF